MTSYEYFMLAQQAGPTSNNTNQPLPSANNSSATANAAGTTATQMKLNTGQAVNQTATPSLSVATDPGSGKC